MRAFYFNRKGHLESRNPYPGVMTDPAPPTTSPDAAPAIPALAVIDEPTAVTLLCDPRYIETLAPFLRRSRPLGEVTERLELKLTTLYHRAQRLRDAGLLVVTGHEARAGRPKLLYRACADALFVPFRTTAFATLDELMETLTSERAREFPLDVTAALERIAPSWGIRIEPTAGDRPGLNVQLAPSADGYDDAFQARLFGPDTPAVFSSSGTFRLQPEDAKALQRDLLELAQRYTEKADPKGVVHHFRFGLAPARERG